VEDIEPRKYVGVDLVPPSPITYGRLAPRTIRKDRIRGVDVYVLGGETGGVLSTEVDVYHVATRTWSRGPSLPAPVEDAGSAVAHHTIYVIGGDNGSTPVSNVVALTAPAPPANPRPTSTPTKTPIATPTNTPQPTATATATPLPTATTPPKPKSCPKHAGKKGSKCVCKKGYKMKHGKCVRKP
jgi:hypothetical protein